MLDFMLLKILMPFVVVLVVRSVLVMVLVNYIKELDIPVLKEIMTNGALVSTLSLFTLSVSAWTINHTLGINDRLCRALFRARHLLQIVLGSTSEAQYTVALRTAMNCATMSIRADVKAQRKNKPRFFMFFHPYTDVVENTVGAHAQSQPPDKSGAVEPYIDEELENFVPASLHPAKRRRKCFVLPLGWVVCVGWNLVTVAVTFCVRVVFFVLKAALFVDTSLSVTSPMATGLGMHPDVFIGHVSSICAERVDTGVAGRALSAFFGSLLVNEHMATHPPQRDQFLELAADIQSSVFNPANFMVDSLLAVHLTLLYLVLPTYFVSKYQVWALVPVIGSVVLSIAPLVITRALRNPFRYYESQHVNRFAEILPDYKPVMGLITTSNRAMIVFARAATCGMSEVVWTSGGLSTETSL
jgi:hypothetical protein